MVDKYANGIKLEETTKLASPQILTNYSKGLILTWWNTTQTSMWQLYNKLIPCPSPYLYQEANTTNRESKRWDSVAVWVQDMGISADKKLSMFQEYGVTVKHLTWDLAALTKRERSYVFSAFFLFRPPSTLHITLRKWRVKLINKEQLRRSLWIMIFIGQSLEDMGRKAGQKQLSSYSKGLSC